MDRKTSEQDSNISGTVENSVRALSAMDAQINSHYSSDLTSKADEIKDTDDGIPTSRAQSEDTRPDFYKFGGGQKDAP